MLTIEDAPIAPELSSFAGAIVTAAIGAFVIAAMEILRNRSESLMRRPSLSLTPWQQPFGLIQFVLLTLLFTSFWGFAIAFARAIDVYKTSAWLLALSTGGLLGMYGAYFSFRSRFAA